MRQNFAVWHQPLIGKEHFMISIDSTSGMVRIRRYGIFHTICVSLRRIEKNISVGRGESIVNNKKSKFWTKIEFLAIYENFRQKSKFWPYMKILDKNRVFGHKWKLEKIEILAIYDYLLKSSFWPYQMVYENFGHKSNVLPYMKILDKNRKFRDIWKFWTKIKSFAVYENW